VRASKARRAAAPPPPFPVWIAHDPTEQSAGPTTQAVPVSTDRPVIVPLLTWRDVKVTANPALTPSAGEGGPHDVGSAHTVSVPPAPHWELHLFLVRGIAWVCAARPAELGRARRKTRERETFRESRVEGSTTSRGQGQEEPLKSGRGTLLGLFLVTRAARNVAPPRRVLCPLDPSLDHLASGATSSKGEAPLAREGQGGSNPSTRERCPTLRIHESVNYANGCSAHSMNVTNRRIDE
jgi:hypothetical protein